ncbi:hypothetical protein K438DRAFT_1760349 [Mycena galopus ATCC 62051]|nr:hypothetical protein K438DRAFT_1760349 [Mycena galopus ATCC 62051]
MADTVPHDLDVLAKDPRYKDFIVFFPNRDEPHNYVDLNLPVFNLIMVTSGVSNGHWFFCLVHDQEKDVAKSKRTYVNCKCGKLQRYYGQTWVGPLTWSDTWKSYDLAVSPGHKVHEFLDVLLHPSASPADGVFEDAPMLWYQYVSSGTAGCRHWTESAARAFHRKGLMQGSAEDFQEKITEGGKIEKVNHTNPKGPFFKERPTDATSEVLAAQHDKDDQGPPYPPFDVRLPLVGLFAGVQSHLADL